MFARYSAFVFRLAPHFPFTSEQTRASVILERQANSFGANISALEDEITFQDHEESESLVISLGFASLHPLEIAGRRIILSGKELELGIFQEGVNAGRNLKIFCVLICFNSLAKYSKFHLTIYLIEISQVLPGHMSLRKCIHFDSLKFDQIELGISNQRIGTGNILVSYWNK